MTDSRHLGQLTAGEVAAVGGMDLPETAAGRLREMGFLTGASVRMVRRAPLVPPILADQTAIPFSPISHRSHRMRLGMLRPNCLPRSLKKSMFRIWRGPLRPLHLGGRLRMR